MVSMRTTLYQAYLMRTELKLDIGTWYMELTPVLGVPILYQHGTGFGRDGEPWYLVVK